MAAANQNLMDEFESSLQNCLSAFTNQEHFNVTDPDESKQSAEQNVSKFLDVARQMEAFFLQKRMQLSVHKPELIIKEDILELKAELARKDALLEKHQNNLLQWQTTFARSGGAAGQQNQQGVPGQPQPQPQSLPTQQLTPQQGHSPGHAVPQPAPMPPPGQHGNYPAGPLAYLEQTTSNIGMPERR